MRQSALAAPIQNAMPDLLVLCDDDDDVFEKAIIEVDVFERKVANGQ